MNIYQKSINNLKKFQMLKVAITKVLSDEDVEKVMAEFRNLIGSNET